ncbi:MAG TPA: ABC transporter ATP-binding protein [Egicoccus sp.]|nr:ABC transporter ATP-binding protein [Egicoccus sp.]HSK22497.1 ABC transporter ATP-binding protein [Egicoccus sp.]
MSHSDSPDVHPPGIEVRDLTVRYGDKVAVDGLDLHLTGGKIHGLLGRNGSGKTSLLSVIAAFRRATSGQVTVGGRPVFEAPDVVADICFIRGSGDTVTNDWPDDKVKHALGFAATVRPRWDATLADALVERFALPLDTRLGELSRGQRSALGITLGLASRAPVTIFDESYLGMDAPSRYAFYDVLLADVTEHPRTVVISTHHIEEVARVFEQVAIIDDGRLVLQGDADDLRGEGATVTGAAEAVEDFTAGREVLATRHLGPTRSATVFGALTADERRHATQMGLEVGPVPLQDLFVHLTEPTRVAARNGSL